MNFHRIFSGDHYLHVSGEAVPGEPGAEIEQSTGPKISDEDSYYPTAGEVTTESESTSNVMSIKEILGINTTFETIYYLNFATATVHALSAIIILAVSVGVKPTVPPIPTDIIGPYIPAVCYRPTVVNATNATDNIRPTFLIEPSSLFDLKVYLAVLVTTFFALSAICQTAQGAFKQSYKERVEQNGTNWFRYIEYSMSASVMMVAIACTLMIYDFYTHLLIFGLTMICMLLGLVADCIRTNARAIDIEFRTNNEPTLLSSKTDSNGESVTVYNYEHDDPKHLTIMYMYELMWFAHTLGWVAMLMPYLGVYAGSYIRLVTRQYECLEDLPDTEESAPFFVHLIVICQFILFSWFGCVQLAQFASNTIHDPIKDKAAYDRETAVIGIRTEHRFVILSLLAKSLLGWLVAANVIFL
jgi:hypothetical protein